MKKKRNLIFAFAVLLSLVLSIGLAGCSNPEIKTITVTFNTKGGEAVEAVTHTIGKEPNLPTGKREGFKFGGWYIDDNYTAKANKENLTEDITLYAEWLLEINYIIDGSIKDTKTVRDGDLLEEYKPGAVAGSELDGWYIKDDYTGDKYNFESKVTQSFDLHARWKFTVIYKFGYDNLESVRKVVSGEKTENIVPGERDGFDFIHWKEAGATEAYDFESPVTGALTLEAVWDVSNAVKVTITDWDGTLIDTQRVVKGEYAVLPDSAVFGLKEFIGFVDSGIEYDNDDEREIIDLEDYPITAATNLTVAYRRTPSHSSYFYFTPAGNSFLVGKSKLQLTAEIILPPTFGGKIVEGVVGGSDMGAGGFSGAEFIEIYIPADYKSIGGYAFYSCAKLRTVTFGQDSILESLGISSFFECEALMSIDLPESLITIGERSFQYCHAMTTLNIPKNVSAIGNFLIFESAALTDITVAAENQNYTAADGVLYNKDMTVLMAYPIGNSRTSFTIPDSVVTIATAAFRKASKLGLITANNTSNLHTIESFAFSLIKNPAGIIELPGSLRVLSSQSFYETDAAVTIAEGILAFEERAFSTYMGEIIEIPASVEDLGTYLFISSTVKTVVFREGTLIDKIPDGTFYSCERLTSVTLPDAVTEIGSQAFYKCLQLPAVTFPAALETIGPRAFSGCVLLGNLVFPQTLKYIKNNAFSNCPRVTAITLNAGLEEIGDYAFSLDHNVPEEPGYATRITELLIPSTVKIIGERAFYFSEYLTEVIFEENSLIETIGSHTFFNSKRLSDVSFGDNSNLKLVPRSIFSGCNIINIDFGANSKIENISESMFDSNANLVSITIPAQVKKIETYAFWKCSSLANIVFESNDNLEEIGDNALAYTALTKLTLPSSVSVIGMGVTIFSKITELAVAEGALQNIKAVDGSILSADGTIFILYPFAKVSETFEIPEGVKHIKNHAFYYVPNIKNFIITEGVVETGNNMFYMYPDYSYTSNLETVYIAGTVKTMGDRSFANHPKLKTVEFGEGSVIDAIGAGSFSGCKAMTSIKFTAAVPPTLGASVFNEVTASILVPAAVVNSYKTNVSWADYKNLITGY